MNKNFEFKLRFALDAAEWDAIKDAPDDWVQELYPEVILYGGSYYHVERLLDRLRNNDTQALKYLALVMDKKLMEDKIGKTLDGKKYLESLPENKSFRLALQNLEIFEKTLSIHIAYFLKEMVITEEETVLQKLPPLSDTWDALSALQMRDYITWDSVFTLTDYNVLTAFVRKNLGQIHPDDDPVLGMTVWPSLEEAV